MFSVVIPVYNHEQYVAFAVDSALTSPLTSEVILVDDGSADDSARIVKSLAKSHGGRVRDLTDGETVNRGAHARLNQLCEAARSEWICVLNSDDLFMPGRLDAIRLTARKTRAQFVAGSMVLIDGAGKFLGTKRGIAEPEYPFPDGLVDRDLRTTIGIRQALCNQNFIATTSNMAFTKSLFDHIGGFSNLRYSHDWDFSLRASLEGRCAFVPHFLTKYRIHETNTIKEVSGHVDGEITRFFFRLMTMYPELEVDPICKKMLDGNRHLAAYVSRDTLWPQEEIRVCRSEVLEPGDWTDISPRPAIIATFTLEHYDYDFVTVSADLADPPQVRIDTLAMRTSFRTSAKALIESGTAPEAPLRGRIIRCPFPGSAQWPVSDLQCMRGFEDARVHERTVLFNDAVVPSFKGSRVSPALKSNVKKDDRPIVLVLPMFMSVGGVERNTVEIIRQLRHIYQFFVVTTEYMGERQGSLHYQLDELEIPCLDLSEVGDRSDHIYMMEALRHSVDPDLVWICNGSPWLVENSAGLRRIFADVPIVDQQVYDTDFGWINEYHRPSIQSFDYFIAINAKIHDQFVEKIRIPRSRVRLIYPALDANKFARGIPDRETVNALKQGLGLPADSEIFAFIGRLSAQKRPLDFLELVRRSQNANEEVTFVLLGDGELSNECDRFINNHSLTNIVCIRHFSDLWGTINAFDGLIITSEFEGLPIAMLESLSFGKPVLSTDVGDIAPVLGDYGSGRVIKSIGDADDLWREYKLWRKALPELAEAAVRHARSVVERFSASAIAAQYDELWHLAIAEVGGRVRDRTRTPYGEA